MHLLQRTQFYSLPALQKPTILVLSTLDLFFSEVHLQLL